MKEKVEREKNRLSKKQYSDLLKCIELRDIYLKSSKSVVNRNAFRGKASLSFNEKVGLISNNSDLAMIEVDYNLKAISGRSRVFLISVQFAVVIETKRDIPTEFFNVYNKTSLPMQLFPYFREYVQSTISRMGLPSLVIPLRKFLISKD